MKRNVLLGVTGGVAAYRACDLARRLMESGIAVTVVMTRSATRFVTPLTFAALTGNPVYTDDDTHDDPMAHITLARKADLILVAPATANVLGKLACGVADDLLTTTLVAGNAPIIVVPAMNSQMWQNQAVVENVATLRARGVRFVGPAEGLLACGETGEGKMAPVEEIVAAVAEELALRRDLAGFRLLVTAGGTREPIDAVRYVGNRSTGKMGVALAEAAQARGADVTLIAAAMEVAPPEGIPLVRAETASAMRAALAERFEGCDGVVMAAAVGDYACADPAPGKVKKREAWRVELTPNPDLIAELGMKKRGRILVGFAAETDTPVEYGREKLIRKNLDLIVVNDVSRSDIGFGADQNEVIIIARSGETIAAPKAPKREVADAILDHVARLVAARTGEATA
ncbi:MAG: bifunctional phosphopantothenoylcysteine decarboxylase/phosphopantothenate--cysteine ligase CoaBC [Nitrospinae bacterium]|nr:bifunctional phosphopantothenoylcysteine decarboxylase/phosphopantothenate--cysteine ligase CoaBC [Nitrospinota bacterium]